MIKIWLLSVLLNKKYFKLHYSYNERTLSMRKQQNTKHPKLKFRLQINQMNLESEYQEISTRANY
jgi:hypothetical protein